jgi:hypothetical protein
MRSDVLLGAVLLQQPSQSHSEIGTAAEIISALLRV